MIYERITSRLLLKYVMEWSSKEKSLLNFLTIILLFEYVYNMLAYMLAY